MNHVKIKVDAIKVLHTMKGGILEAWARLRKEFDERNINIPISGPDWTDMPPFQEEKLGMVDIFGAIDINSYHGSRRKSKAMG